MCQSLHASETRLNDQQLLLDGLQQQLNDARASMQDDRAAVADLAVEQQNTIDQNRRLVTALEVKVDREVNKLESSIEQAINMIRQVSQESVAPLEGQLGNLQAAIVTLNNAARCAFRGTFENGRCTCHDGFFGSACDRRLPTSCKEYKALGETDDKLYDVLREGVATKVPCVMSVDTGGYELAVQFGAVGTWPALGRRSYFATTTTAAAANAAFKSKSYSQIMSTNSL